MAYIELHDVVKDFKIKNRRNGAFGNDFVFITDKEK